MSEWKECRLGDYIDINPSERLAKGTMAKKISMDCIQPYYREIINFKHSKYSGGAEFKNLDTLMARITPCLENGKTAMVNILNHNEIAFGSTEFTVFRAKQGLTDPYYIYYLTISDLVREPAIKSMVGSSGRQRVQNDVIENLKIPLPPLDTQRKIASILSALDDKIELNRRMNKNLGEQARAIYKSWFVDFEPWGGMMPEEWVKISLFNIAKYINGAAFSKDEYGVIGTPIVKISELKNGITNSTQYCCTQKDDKYYIKNKDILFSWSGNPDTSIDTFLWCDGDAILNQHTFRVVSNYNTQAFVYFLLKSFKPIFTHIASNKQTTGLGHVTITDLKQLHIYTDVKSMKKYNDITQSILDKIYCHNMESRALATLRDTLLPKLMRGEIDVENVVV